MDDATRAVVTSFVKSVVDRAVVASGVALITHGWLTASQTSLYEQVGTGLVMALIGAGVGWYRDHGKTLVQAEVNRLNDKVDALTKQVAQPAKRKT